MPQTGLFFFGCDATNAMETFGADQSSGSGRYGVRRYASFDLQNIFLRAAGEEKTVIDALLAVNQGKVGVRAEAENGQRVVRYIVLHIFHAGLFIASEESPDGIMKLRTTLLQIFERIEAEHGGPFIVHDAAPDEVAVFFAQDEGVGLPAIAGRDNVDMGDRGEIGTPIVFADRGIAKTVFAINGFQTKLPGDFQRAVERPTRFTSEGSALLGFRLDAWNGDETGHIPKDLLFIVANKLVNGMRINHAGLLLKVNMIVDMLAAEAMIACAAGAVAKLEIGIVGIGPAADGAFVAIEAVALFAANFGRGLPEVDCGG